MNPEQITENGIESNLNFEMMHPDIDLEALSLLFHAYRNLSVSLHVMSMIQDSRDWLLERFNPLDVQLYA